MINIFSSLPDIGNFDDNIRLALDYLIKTQNADGGWGYKAGGQSFTEPTAMALLALFHPKGAGKLNAPPNYIDAVQKGLLRLRSDQHQDGGWGIFKDDPFSSWMTYPAIWVYNVMLKIPELSSLYGKPEDVDARSRGRNWIINKAREPKVSDKDYQIIQAIFHIDSNLLGWKWGPNPTEAGFVIPTSLAIIALTVEDRLVVADSDQVMEGKAYLRDRACNNGGWNIGNPTVFDKDLPPTADGTAYALLAFAVSLGRSDFGETKEIWSGVSALADFVENSRSDQTVVLGTLALRFYPDINGNTAERLTSFYNKLITGKGTAKEKSSIGQNKNGGWAESPFTTALAALALSEDLYFFQPG